MKKKIKDLTVEERKKICDKYYTGYNPEFNNCSKCPFCIGEEDFGRAICGEDMIDFVNQEIEVEDENN